MAKLIARLGDGATHPGQIVTAAKAAFAEGPPIARVGDTFNCLIHGPNPIVTGSPDTPIEGAMCAHDGSRTVCGALIIAGSTSSYVSGG